MKYNINGHTVTVPDDMKVIIDDECIGGAYDSILYKGYEIFTFDTPLYLEEYTGRFLVSLEGDGSVDDPIFETLEDVKAYVDAISKRFKMTETWFPIKIKICSTGEEHMIYFPSEIPTGVAFIVLKTRVETTDNDD